MSAFDRSRREILKAAGLCAASAAAAVRGGRAQAEEAVPFSSGTAARIEAPGLTTS